MNEAAKGTVEGTTRDSEADGEASAEARKPHNYHNVINHPRKERASNIASIFIFIPIKPHGSGGVLDNKQSNSNKFPNHLTNKKGINLNKDNGKKPNKTRDKEPTNKTNKGKSLTTNRDELTQGNTGNWLNNRENKNTKTSIDSKRLTPQEVLKINTASTMTTTLLKRAISNAYRHGLGLKTGILNEAKGNCILTLY